MFFLRNAWIIPAIPVASFWLILFFGKRLPHKGSEIGSHAISGAVLRVDGGIVVGT